MKSLFLGMIVLFLTVFPACISSMSYMDHPDYRAGIAYGDEMAKQDAMDDPCIHRFPGYDREMQTYLYRHMREMKGNRSEAFLKGFDHGYRREFFGYMSFYCGE